MSVAIAVLMSLVMLGTSNERCPSRKMVKLISPARRTVVTATEAKPLDLGVADGRIVALASELQASSARLLTPATSLFPE